MREVMGSAAAVALVPRSLLAAAGGAIALVAGAAGLRSGRSIDPRGRRGFPHDQFNCSAGPLVRVLSCCRG